MITGFNTDIEYQGTTYHVQTEDKGLETPLILSLVYVGGAILASKRSPYDDLIAEGFNEITLTERLQRQHKLICAAIKSGRVEDLKRIGHKEPQEETKKTSRKAAKPPAVKPQAAKPQVVEPTPPEPATAQPASEQTPTASIRDLLIEGHEPIVPVEIIRRPVLEILPEPEETTRLVPIVLEEGFPVHAADTSDELYLKLLDDEGEFRAGQFATIKIYAGRGKYGQQAVMQADVTVKVLGTAFRPLLLSTKTNDEGIAVVRAILPRFTSGRAALLIRAVTADGEQAELRRIIQQA